MIFWLCNQGSYIKFVLAFTLRRLICIQGIGGEGEGKEGAGGKGYERRRGGIIMNSIAHILIHDKEIGKYVHIAK